MFQKCVFFVSFESQPNLSNLEISMHTQPCTAWSCPHIKKNYMKKKMKDYINNRKVYNTKYTKETAKNI